jgi:predicted dehydrogenase
MHDRLKVGVIGVGYLGRFHARNYARLPDCELVGVADIDAARAHAVAAEVGCAAFTDPTALLDKVQAVSVVVPTTVHLEVARPYLTRGIHMLLEKPVAADLATAEEIVRLAEASGAILQIGHLERFNAGVMALAQRIENPRYIEAQRMGGFVDRATDVDVVSDLMIHDIDIVLALVHAEIAEIRAIGTPVLTPHVDIASARLAFTDGTVANVVASRVSDRKTRRIRVFQPRCYMSLDFVDQTLDLAAPEEVAGAARPEIRRTRVSLAAVKPLDEEIEAFVYCVRRGLAPLVDGRTGLKALAVALAVREHMARS